MVLRALAVAGPVRAGVEQAPAPISARRATTPPASCALRRQAAASLAAAAVVLTAVGPAAAGPDLRLGEEVFSQNCAVCHAGGLNNIKGEEKHTLRRDAMERYGFTSIDAITKQVNAGKDAMPAFEGVLSEGEIEAVAAFVLDHVDKW